MVFNALLIPLINYLYVLKTYHIQYNVCAKHIFPIKYRRPNLSIGIRYIDTFL